VKDDSFTRSPKSTNPTATRTTVTTKELKFEKFKEDQTNNWKRKSLE
jgi:hypothetical protein